MAAASWLCKLLLAAAILVVATTTTADTRYEPTSPVVDPILCEKLLRENKTETRTLTDLCLHHHHSLPATPHRASPPRTDAAAAAAAAAPAAHRGRSKKSAVKTRLKVDEQKRVVELHNKYRRLVQPAAGNMKFMKWDDHLAEVAQMWAENCEFEHGFPDEIDEENMGQNLYVGPDPSGVRATVLWWEEYAYYHFHTRECDEDEECGHYTQLVWADSEFVGCGVARCPVIGEYFVCHYFPQGNHPDEWPYVIGAPCSQCHSRNDGGLCHDGFCASKSDCATFNMTCSCNVTCHNCATLSKPYCRCICKNGWDSTDCSRLCVDEHESCNQMPGWSDINACRMVNHTVRDRHCRKMCLQCKIVPDDDDEAAVMKRSNSKDYCCAGRLCPTGMVLDTSTCDCVLLCPGPSCNETDSSSPHGKETERPENASKPDTTGDKTNSSSGTKSKTDEPDMLPSRAGFHLLDKQWLLFTTTTIVLTGVGLFSSHLLV